MHETEWIYEELEKVIIGSDEDKYFQVGTQLPPAEKEELLVFLRKNVDSCSQKATTLALF